MSKTDMRKRAAMNSDASKTGPAKIPLDSHIIESFKIHGESGYSEYWRRDKSPVETLELAKILTALRKVVSHIGRNAGSVSWKETVESEIMIDPKPVMGKYPVPAAKTDIIVGEAVRCAFKNIEMSRYALKLAKADLNLSFRHMYKFELYFKTCEKIYFDGLANRNILGVYTEKSRQRYIWNSLDATSHPPSLSELFALWWEMAADREKKNYLEEFVDQSSRKAMTGVSLEKFYKKPMRILNSMVPALFDDCPKIAGTTERCRFRADLYVKTWEKLFAYIQFWAVDQSDIFLQARQQESHQLKGVLKKKLPAELVFSEKLGRVVKKKPPENKEKEPETAVDTSIAQVVENTIVLPAENYVNKKLLQDLSSVFKAVAVRKSIYNRGLRSGNIDRRRLYRAHTIGTVFNTKKNEFALLNDIVVIVDATGSMAATNKWEHTQEVFQTLYLAARSFNKNACLYAYNEIRNRCLLTKMYTKGGFFTIQPSGKTASGDVIKTLLKKTKGKNKKPIFIHITDGASNWGCPVDEAIDLCKKNRTLLLTLGVNCSRENKDLLKEEYGRLVQFADSVDMLPSLMRNLLVRGKRAFTN